MVSGFPWETEPTGYICKEIYYKEKAYMIMEAKKFQPESEAGELIV